MAFLYQITSPSGKRYIGVTVQSVANRWRRHINDAHREDFLLSRAIRKYGADSFEVKTLAQVEESEMFELEKRVIKALGTKAPGGYNLTDGGEGMLGFSRPLSRDHKAKLRAAKLGKKRGPISEETRARISKAKLGHSCSPETRAKIAEAHRGRSLSPDHKAKISASLTRHHQGV